MTLDSADVTEKVCYVYKITVATIMLDGKRMSLAQTYTPQQGRPYKDKEELYEICRIQLMACLEVIKWWSWGI